MLPDLEDVVRALGKKWTIPILAEIEEKGFDGFNRFVERVDGLTPKVLSSTLQDLESADLVERVSGEDEGERTQYELTEKGMQIYELVSGFETDGEK